MAGTPGRLVRPACGKQPARLALDGMSRPILSQRQWRGSPPRRRWWYAWRPWLGLALLLAVWIAYDRAFAPGAPHGTPQRIAQSFHRCGQGHGPNCVIDGDTFVMTRRHIRIIGIDAPEIGAKARCPEEARGAEQAAGALLALLNQGPFEMTPPEDGLRDEYGRELMTLTRRRTDGGLQDIARDMIASGTVRAYDRGARLAWCR